MFTFKEPQLEIGRPSHALVIGGSIAGLLAARVLINHFDRVTIVERDRLPDEPVTRPGVPQGSQVHVILTQGQRILEQLFPGLTQELTAAGAPTVDWLADWKIFGIWGWGVRFRSGFTGYTASRNFLELVLRRRLSQSERLQFIESTQVTGLLTNADCSSITGVKLRCRTETDTTSQGQSPELSADLVVDASGRNSRMPKWLTSLGYQSPQITVVNSFLGYASRWYECPKEFVADWQGITVMSQPPSISRGAVLYPVEGNRWVVTLGGVAQDYPPQDEAGFLEFARSLRSPIIYEAIKDAKPLSSVTTYRRTENRLCHYEQLDRLPEGVVVIGDAVCAFNPVYGQGITIAAMAALSLDECLQQQFQRQHGNLTGLTRRFQQRLAKLNATPWMMATAEDFRWSTTVGGKPNRINQLMQRYIDTVQQLMLNHPSISRAFLEVAHMVKPPTVLFHPSIIARVLWSSISKRSISSEMTVSR